MLYTRVTVRRSGSGWVAAAAGGAAGDVQVRFQRSGASADMPGTIHVAGTITGTAVHMPELLPVPTGGLRAEFGPDDRTRVDGIGFSAGSLNASTAGLDGVGTGSFTVTPEAPGESCSVSSFSWSIFPPQ